MLAFSPAADISAPGNQYFRAVNTAHDFAAGLQGAAVPPVPAGPPYAQGVSAFTQTKTDAMRWINEIYPADLSLPVVVEDAAAFVTPALALLVRLAGQYVASPQNQQLHQETVDSAAMIAGKIASLQEQMAALSTAIESVRAVVAADEQSVFAAMDPLGARVRELNRSLGGALYMLQVVLSGRSPNPQEVQRLEAAIAADEQELEQVQSFSGFLRQVAIAASRVAQGLSYMGTYWTARAGAAGAIVQTLQHVATADPAGILADAEAASLAWAQL